MVSKKVFIGQYSQHIPAPIPIIETNPFHQLCLFENPSYTHKKINYVLANYQQNYNTSVFFKSPGAETTT